MTEAAKPHAVRLGGLESGFRPRRDHLALGLGDDGHNADDHFVCLGHVATNRTPAFCRPNMVHISLSSSWRRARGRMIATINWPGLDQSGRHRAFPAGQPFIKAQPIHWLLDRAAGIDARTVDFR
jgi:hypothetical protein